MKFHSGRPTCVFVWVSVSCSSGHVNRISLFHAQSHPAITDPWGCVERVCLHAERGQHRREDIRPDQGVHFSSMCVLARGYLVCNLKSHFGGKDILLHNLHSRLCLKVDHFFYRFGKGDQFKTSQKNKIFCGLCFCFCCKLKVFFGGYKIGGKKSC